MEDLLYGLDLCAEGVDVACLKSLDTALSPGTLREQYLQASRWFRGLMLVAAQLVPSVRRRDWARAVICLHAAWLGMEWLLRTVGPAVVAGNLIFGRNRKLSGILAFEYVVELLAAQLELDKETTLGACVGAVAAFPIVQTAFGVGGWRALLMSSKGRDITRVTPKGAMR